MRHPIPALLAATLLVGTSGLAPLDAAAQSRMSDRDVDHLIANLQQDVHSFRDPFKHALKKSAIRHTSQEKDANNSVRELEQQVDALHRNFRKTKRGDARYATLKANAATVDSTLRSISPAPEAQTRWAKVEADLAALDPAFGAD